MKKAFHNLIFKLKSGRKTDIISYIDLTQLGTATCETLDIYAGVKDRYNMSM